MSHVARTGWHGVVVHFRGCSGEPNRLPRAYHSGDSAEIDWILQRLAKLQGGPVHPVGVSLGGNALLKWLGEHGTDAVQFVRAAATISAPVDLMAAGAALGRGFNLIYTHAFLRTLKRKSLAKLARHPDLYDPRLVRRASTLRAFDDVVTAPLHGFRRIPTITGHAQAANRGFRPSRSERSSSTRATTLFCPRPRCLPASTWRLQSSSNNHPMAVTWASSAVVRPVTSTGCLSVSFASSAPDTDRGLRAGRAAIRPPPPPTIARKRVQMTATPKSTIAPQIFRVYDIRGIVATALTPEATEIIGQAIGSEAKDRGVKEIAIGRDGRLTGPICHGRSHADCRPPVSTSSISAWWQRRFSTSPAIISGRVPASP